MSASSALECHIHYFKQTSGTARTDVICGPPCCPIACSCSAHHFLVLDISGPCSGFGSNSHGELHSSLPPRVASFSPIPLDNLAREIAAGLAFSSFILASGHVVVHGSCYSDVPPAVFVAPRGLTAHGLNWAFVEKQNCVMVFTGKARRRLHVRDENVISTAFTDSSVLALTAAGSVYAARLDQKASFSHVAIGFPVFSLFGSSGSFFLANYSNQLFEHSETINPLSIAFDSETFSVQRSNEHLFRLDGKGRLLELRDGEVPIGDAYACFSLLPHFVVAFCGRPSPAGVIRAPPADYLPICQCVFSVRTGSSEFQLLAFDATRVYLADPPFYDMLQRFRSLFLSPDASVESRKDPARKLYYTRTGRFVFPEVDESQSYSFNFLVGDTIETSFGVGARFVGTQGGRVWFQPSDSRCVFSILNLRSLSCRSRPGHDIQTVMIDGSPAVLDRTPEFCEGFGRAIGDLIWFPRRGIVQFVGMFARRYVFLDFSDNSLFSSEPYNFLVVRGMSRKFAAPRKTLTAEGELVELDVCAATQIFLPGDRVTGDFGGGTFLGTDDRGSRSCSRTRCERTRSRGRK
jgi:hypothetical protein